MHRNASIIWVFIVDYAKDWGVRRHTHDFYQMYYCLSGSGTMFVNGSDIRIDEGDCLIIKPGEEHELYALEGGQLRILDTKFHILDQELVSFVDALPSVTNMPEAEYKQLQLSIRDWWVGGKEHQQDIANLLLEQALLTRVPSTYTRHSPKFYLDFKETEESTSGIAKEIADYLHAHSIGKISLDEISEHIGYSKNYLCKAFKNATGYTINQYQTLIRMTVAWDLVCYTNNSFETIALQCGYEDVHYFSRSFKKVTGMTPSQARNQDKDVLHTDLKNHGTFHYRYYLKENNVLDHSKLFTNGR